ncbi:DUF6973 domain-containing protein [Streptomyces daliensis]|uniref:DUF6973 domain-containing protein n=1 Tax=Streptomyces daliensis TaxID=299421 RepID=A0A8T4IUP2_9ACTN|nr:hypothetical protein [Streptomyces daliensis]
MKSRPLEGTAYLKISEWASKTAEEEADKNPNLDKNAFRHAIWQAKLTYLMGEDKAKLWADAHEAYHPKSAHPDHMADLVNNEYGRDLGHRTESEGPAKPITPGGPSADAQAEERILDEARRYAQSDDFAHEDHFNDFD